MKISEEEKKAINELCRFDYCYNEQIKTILNLIEKLQKENEELEEENFNLQCISKQYIELYEKYKKLYERRTNL